MARMYYPNPIEQEQNKMNNEELAEHFGQMIQAQKQRQKDTEQEVAGMTFEKLIELRDSINEKAVSHSERTLKATVELELARRSEFLNALNSIGELIICT